MAQDCAFAMSNLVIQGIRPPVKPVDFKRMAIDRDSTLIIMPDNVASAARTNG